MSDDDEFESEPESDFSDYTEFFESDNIPCYITHEPSNVHPVLQAVLTDDVSDFQLKLAESGLSVNFKDESFRNNTPLHVAVKWKKLAVFNFLLSLNDTEIDPLNSDGVSPLLKLADSCPTCEPISEYFVSELIKKGANVNISDNNGRTFLHSDIIRHKLPDGYKEQLKLHEILIQNDININAQDFNGETPLFNACRRQYIDYVHMLLYYGADVSIQSNQGCLPVGVLKDNHSLQEILFDYTFDDDKVPINLSTLREIVSSGSSLLFQIPNKISDVICDKESLLYLRDDLHYSYISLNNFKFFLEEFAAVVKQLLLLCDIRSFICMDPSCLDSFYKRTIYIPSEFIQFVYIIFESPLVADFVECARPADPIIASVIDWLKNEISIEEITSLVCLMLSYGINATSLDVIKVFEVYGFCDLYDVLLHMDIMESSSFYYLDFDDVIESTSVIPLLMYNLHIDIKAIVDNYNTCRLEELLDYFADPKIKEIISTVYPNYLVDNKIKEMPQVPYLTELSRDAARTYIIEKFDVKNSGQFYAILKQLPIGEMNKRILSFRQKLYNF